MVKIAKKTGGILTILGLDTSQPGEYIDNRATPNCQNMSINRSVLVKRVGTTAVGSTQSEEIMAGREFEENNVRYVVRIGLDEIHKLDTTNNIWTNITTPLTVSNSNNKFNFNIGAAELTATVTNGTYPLGNAETETGSLCKALYTAIVAAEATGTYTVRVTANRVVITRSAGTFQILWKTGTNGSDGTDTHIGTLLGYVDTADNTGALTYTATNNVTTDLTGTTNDIISTAVPLLSGARLLVFTNNVDNIRKYTGSGGTQDLGGSPPKCKFLIDYKTYLVLAHITSGDLYSMRVQWSDTGAIETWTGGNSGSQDLISEGEEITGLNRLGDYITVHKKNCIYVGYLVSSSAIFQFDRKDTGVGTVCNATIQELPTGGQIFLATDGLHIFNGISAELIANPIVDELRETINPEYVHKSWSVIVNELDEYWLGVPIGSQTSPDTIYKFNYKTGQVHKDTRSGITAVWKYTQVSSPSWDDESGTWDEATDSWDSVSLLKLADIIMLGDSSGVTYKRDTTVNNDSSAVISSFWDSKEYESEEKGRLCRWVQTELWAKGNTVKLEYSIDNGITWVLVDTYTLTSDYPTDSSPIMAYFDVISSHIRFRFSNAVSSETFSLKQFIISYKDREIRQ